jgi:hypothetical protein
VTGWRRTTGESGTATSPSVNSHPYKRFELTTHRYAFCLGPPSLSCSIFGAPTIVLIFGLRKRHEERFPGYPPPQKNTHPCIASSIVLPILPEGSWEGAFETTQRSSASWPNKNTFSFRPGTKTMGRQVGAHINQATQARTYAHLTELYTHYLACKVSLTPLNYKRVSPKISTFRRYK